MFVLYSSKNLHLLFLGDVSVGIKCDARVVSSEEEDIDFDIIHNANDTFTVKYSPPAAGRYTIKVLFAGEVSNLCFAAWSFKNLFICSLITMHLSVHSWLFSPQLTCTWFGHCFYNSVKTGNFFCNTWMYASERSWGHWSFCNVLGWQNEYGLHGRARLPSKVKKPKWLFKENREKRFPWE